MEIPLAFLLCNLGLSLNGSHLSQPELGKFTFI